MSAWRYLARRATSGQWLDLDLPLDRDGLTYSLSGPGSLRATVAPDVGTLRADDGRLLLEEWGTLVYAESGGEIRWGGIVVSSKFDGPKWSVEVAGMTTYPNGLTYEGQDYSVSDTDPADVVRMLWSHVQSYPDGNLGVTVTGSSSSRVGTAEKPYELRWFDAKDAGKEIDSLAKAAPFDYVERVRWSGDDVAHEVLIADRIGRRREDLAFVQGDNVVSLVTPEIHGDDFANEVLGLGLGEGAETLRRTSAVRDGRLRRQKVYSAKDVGDPALLDALIEGERLRRSNVTAISSVTVIDHPNARIGEWQLGDDVLIEASLPWLGDVAIWHRVVAWTLASDSVAQLQLVRSDVQIPRR